ncbi:MAG TPA: hypothetical protein VNO75_12360 [Gemmatimonadaceae bacterium]|nr:hypothetical protein [Gemmatimonadaceae bacterium]
MRWNPPIMDTAAVSGGLVRCVCKRMVTPDMLRPIGSGLGCDVCLERAIRKGEITREDFAQQAGAPPEVIGKARRLDEKQRERGDRKREA